MRKGLLSTQSQCVSRVAIGSLIAMLTISSLWIVPAFADPFAYVTQPSLGSISVIDLATNTVSATLQVGAMPRMLAITPDGTQGYVADFDAASVFVIDMATNTVTTTIPVNGVASDIAVTADGRRVYVVDSGLSVIDTDSNTVFGEVPLEGEPYGVAITPDGTRVYVTTLEGDLLVIDTVTDRVIATIPVGGAPKSLIVTPNGAAVYVTATDEGTISVIDTTSDRILTRIALDDMPYGIAITSDGTRIYVTSAGGVTVIDRGTNSIIATIPAVLTTDVAITSDGSAVYVIEPSTNRVSVIDTATNTLTEIISISSPWGIAITPGDPGPGPSPGDGESAADLTGTLTLLKHTVKATGDTLVAKLTIRNAGRAMPDQSFVVALWSSDDQALGPDDTLLTEIEVDRQLLAPGATTSVKLKVEDVPSLDGTIAIIRIDERDEIMESDEANNLVVHKIGGRGCTNDTFLLEKEPNDTPDQAQSVPGKLKPGRCLTISGFADSNGSDFDGYRFKLKGEQILEFTLTPDSQADFDLVVFETGPPADEIITCTSKTTPEVCSVTITDLPADVTPFDVVVDPFDGLGPYTLDIFSFAIPDGP